MRALSRNKISSGIVHLGVTIVLLLIIPLLAWAIVTQRFDVRRKAATIEPPPTKEYCQSDADCGCGIDVDSGQCAIENRYYLNGICTWPDYCSGIDGKQRPICSNGTCTLGYGDTTISTDSDEYNGPYKLQVGPIQGTTKEITCTLGDSNCFYHASVYGYNKSGKVISETTLYVSPKNNIISFLGFDGKSTTDTSVKTGLVYQDQSGFNTLVKVTPPQSVGTYYSTFYAGGKTCIDYPNNCSYGGASGYTIKVNVVGSSATSTPAPTPSPRINIEPVISTNSLPNAYVRRSYTAKIEAYDLDKTDSLSMNITGLPGGLTWGPCALYTTDRSYIFCNVAGTPTKKGNYSVNVSVTDGRGGVVYKILQLKVLNRFILF